MARPSSVDKLSSEIRDWIGRLREQGRSLDEIIAKLRELDVDQLPSRSALHRHLQKAEAIAERMKHSRAVADVLVRRLGDAEPDRTTRLNIELMHSVVFDLVTAAQAAGDEAGAEGVTLDAQQVMFLAKSLDHLGKAANADVARIVAIEKRAADKAKQEAAAAVDRIGREKGLSEDTLKAIRSGVFGV